VINDDPSQVGSDNLAVSCGRPQRAGPACPRWHL